jgi:hypothetical protein
MATVTGNQILARATVIATQQGVDPNMSKVIDNRGGARALLNETIRNLYRAKANDQKFTNDITTKSTIPMTAGVGAVPDEMMREFLDQAQIADENDSLITYLNYSIDVNQTFDQLGYLWIVDDEFRYLAPSPTLLTYGDDLFITCPSFPTFPASLSSNITFPSEAIIDDLCSALAAELRGSP